MSTIQYIRQKKKVIGLFSGLIAIVFVFVVALSNVSANTDYYLTETSVELDGVHDGVVTVELKAPATEAIYSIWGQFLTESFDGEHNRMYSLTSLTPGGGMSPSDPRIWSNDPQEGVIYYQSWNNPIMVQAGDTLWSATFTIDKDAPAGDHNFVLINTEIASDSEMDTANIGYLYGKVTVTRSGDPSEKPAQVVTFKDEDGNPIEEITKYYGDGDFIITKEVTTGDGEITDYHPDDDGTGTIAHTVPGGDYVGVGEPGDVEICAWVEETANYAETKACYTVHVLKRLISIDSVTVESKVFDGTADATVTGVSFNNGMLNSGDYTATAEFEDANVGESKTATVTVELVGDALNHYDLDESTYDTTAQITPFILTEDNITLVNGYTYGYTGEEIEPEIRVEANVHGGTTTLVEDQDYEVHYTNNVDASDHAYVVVLGKGNYDTPESISVLVLFTIEPRGINNDNLIMPTEVVEGHLVSKSDIRLNYDGQDLVQCDTYDDTNCDFFVTLSGNNTGTVGDVVHVEVEARNNYTGTASGDIEIVEKLPQEVTFEGLDDLEVYKEYGDENFQVVATTNGGGNISYSSSNTNVATVNSETGEVTVVDLGETYITATATAEGDYAEGSASSLLHVSKKHIKVESVWVQDKVYDGTTLAYAAGATLDYDGLVEGVDYHIGEVHFPSSNVGNYEDITVPVILEDSTFERYTFWDGCGPIECGIGGTASITPFELTSSNTSAEVATDYTNHYIGEAIEPEIVAYVDLDGDGVFETNLVFDDYTLNYENNINAGLATIIATGQGNYVGTFAELEFRIYPAVVENVEVTAPSQVYTGEALEPVPTVTGTIEGESVTLEAGDYEVGYADGYTDGPYINAGDYEFAVYGKQEVNYDVPNTTGLFTIEPRGINNDNLIIPASVMEGHVVTESDISVNVDGHDLVRCDSVGDLNCDYTVEITGDNDGVAGHTVHVAINGCNNYTGVGARDIEIVEKLPQTVTFADEEVHKEYGDEDFIYAATTNGDGHVTYSSSDDTVATVDAESGLVTILKSGDIIITATAAETDTYAEGSSHYYLCIAKKVVTYEELTIADKVYDGSMSATVTNIKLSVDELSLGNGFSIYDAHFPSIDVGSYDDVYVKIILDYDFREMYQFGASDALEGVGSASILPFTITADNTTAVLESTEYDYNGEAKEPDVTMRIDLDGDGVKEYDVYSPWDFTVEYANNTNAGTATVTITGAGNYVGSLPALEFTINPATVTNITVTSPSQAYTGEALEPVPTVTGTVGGNSVTLTADDYKIDSHDDFVNAGDYTFTVSSKEGSNYIISATEGSFTIDKADSGEPEGVPTDLAGEAGQTLADLGDLPEGFAWVDDSTVITAGMNNYEAVYTKNGDTVNYNTSTLSVPVIGYTAEYEVIKGAAQEYIIGESESALFEIDASYELFEVGGEVYVDNVLVDSANYDSRDGSTIIEFKKDYMDSLALGEHSLSVLFNDGGIARTTFVVANPVAPDEPAGGESEKNDEPDAGNTGTFTGTTGGAIATGLTVIAMSALTGAVYMAAKYSKKED